MVEVGAVDQDGHHVYFLGIDENNAKDKFGLF